MKVRLVRDDCSPLWVIRCDKPCMPDGWCQSREDIWGRPTMPARWLCWLGAGLDRAKTEALAKRGGHEVVE